MATAIPIFSAVRHQPVAPKSAAARRRQIRQLSALVAIGVVLAVAYVWIRIQVIELGYEVSRMRRETTELGQQKNLIEAQVIALKSPARIEAIGRDQLGMRLPRSDEIIFVDPAASPAAPER